MKQIVQEGWEIVRYNNGEKILDDDIIATEYPLTVYVNDEEFATLVCTPTHIRELVIGFLASEGFIRFFSEIESIKIDKEQGFAYVKLTKELDQDRHSSSKGLTVLVWEKGDRFIFKGI